MPHVVVEDRCLSAVAHLAYARTQNSGTGILGNYVIYRAAFHERLCFILGSSTLCDTIHIIILNSTQNRDYVVLFDGQPSYNKRIKYMRRL